MVNKITLSICFIFLSFCTIKSMEKIGVNAPFMNKKSAKQVTVHKQKSCMQKIFSRTKNYVPAMILAIAAVQFIGKYYYTLQSINVGEEREERLILYDNNYVFLRFITGAFLK